MSSFVIGKASYVRVAGLVSGIADAANEYSSSKMWIYNFEKNRNMIAEDYRERFIACYEMNVDSVNEQYSSWEPQDYDLADYDDEFVRYFQYGKKLYNERYAKPERFVSAIHDISFFKDSVSYQVENMDMNATISEWFNAVIVKLYGLTDSEREERDCWGSFELEFDNSKVF